MTIATDTAQAFWGLLLPHGVHGGALAHVEEDEDNDDDDDESMADDDVGLTQGWSDKHTEWWFDFLSEKGGKGISRDTWTMVRTFGQIRVSVVPTDNCSLSVLLAPSILSFETTT